MKKTSEKLSALALANMVACLWSIALSLPALGLATGMLMSLFAIGAMMASDTEY